MRKTNFSPGYSAHYNDKLKNDDMNDIDDLGAGPLAI